MLNLLYCIANPKQECIGKMSDAGTEGADIQDRRAFVFDFSWSVHACPHPSDDYRPLNVCSHRRCRSSGAGQRMP